MRLLVISDLHTEFTPLKLETLAVDVVVIAGDVNLGTRSIGWLLDNIPGQIPTVLVPGNHEYYSGAYPRTLEKMKQAAQGSSVHVLSDEAVLLDGVEFLGATLWTDFSLSGNRDLAMDVCARQMMDFHKIRVSPRFRKITPRHLLTLHNTSRRWLEARFPVRASTVVVTHHAPSNLSLGDTPRADIGAAFASDLDALVEQSGARLWIHGHVHQFADYWIGQTRVVCNPRGYPDEETGFVPDLVITI